MKIRGKRKKTPCALVKHIKVRHVVSVVSNGLVRTLETDPRLTPSNYTHPKIQCGLQ